MSSHPEGEAGLFDRCSAPLTVANRSAEARIEAIASLRLLRMTAAEIAELQRNDVVGSYI